LGLQTAAVDTADMFATQAGFELAQRMANALSKSTMLPKDFQNNVPNCLVLLDLASRFKHMGISPFTIAQQLVIVHGRPAWYGQFVIALINGIELFAFPLKFRFDGDGDDYGGTAWTAAKDDVSNKLEGVKITRRMVKAEGWDKNAKWRNMEQQMFQYRAAAFFGRVNCPQLLMGYHTADEIEDTVKDVTPRVSEDATDDLATAVGGSRG
jgi:hypothetical protein